MTPDAKQSRKKWSDPERRAYHEAGHAVMRYLLGGKAEQVAIVPGEDGETLECQMAAQSLFHQDIPPDPEITLELLNVVENSMLHLLAGMVAEKSFTKRNDPKLADYDLRTASDLATYLLNNLVNGTRGTAQCIGWLTDKATIALEANLYLVEAIALALLKKRTLTGAEIETHIRKAAGLPEPARTVTPDAPADQNMGQRTIENSGQLLVPGVLIERPK